MHKKSAYKICFFTKDDKLLEDVKESQSYIEFNEYVLRKTLEKLKQLPFEQQKHFFQTMKQK